VSFGNPVTVAKRTTGWSMLWGILMIVCGVLAISMPLASSVGIVIVLAWLVLIAGVSHLIYAFQSHSARGVVWQIVVAVLYGAVGVYLLAHPLLGVASLTLVLAGFFVAEGIIETILYFRVREMAHSGWVLFDAVVTLVLGVMIWRRWPASSVWVLGTLVGISLIFSGLSRVMLSMAARRILVREEPGEPRAA
jgi:uncharacterized membrane protein HdeD (DUF308 family)